MNLFNYGLDLSAVYLGGSARIVQTVSGYVRNQAVRQFSGTLRQGGAFGAIPNRKRSP
jgi:hypothetical protein